MDDICTINIQNFGDIAKDIYDNTLSLEGSTFSYKQDTFSDLYIRVVDHKFITGIYHKVDDFNFEAISYPFPQSNVHSMLGYSTYYSQLIRFFRLCNNINDFLFRAKFSYSKLVKRGYKHNLLLKYFKKFCSAYNIEGKYGEKNSDLLFSRMLKHNPFVSCNINNTKEINDIVRQGKIYCLRCIWTEVPSFESSSVLYISPTDTSSMQNLILECLQQKLQKSCSRCNKNTQHIESSYMLQPPKYLRLFVNRFRYINNNITKNRCPIPMDTTVRLGPLKFSLQATIDHHGPSIDSGHYTASINCCKKHSIATITKLQSLELLIKTPLLHILYYINGLTHDFWTRTGGWEFDRSHGAGTSSPSHWQQVEEQAPKPVGWMMCFLLMTLVPVQKLCVDIYVYIYVCAFLIRVLL